MSRLNCGMCCRSVGYLKIVSYHPHLYFRLKGKARTPSMGLSFLRAWLRDLALHTYGSLWVLLLTLLSSLAGVRRSPDELKAGQVDLTGVTSPYFLYNMTYRNEDFDQLLRLSDYNVRNNQGAILQALKTVLSQRASETRPLGVKT